MTKVVKSLWGCIFILFTCVLVLGGILIFRADSSGSRSNLESGPSSAPPILATVGGNPITKEEWIGELQRQYGMLVLDQMMTLKAVRLEAEALAIDVADEEVAAELRLQMAGYESEEAYYTAMREQLGMNPAQIRDDAINHLRLEKIAIHGIQVTDEEIDMYLTEHRDQFESTIAYEMSHIVTDTLANARKVSDRLAEGEAFSELARQYSIDAFSSAAGGSLGWIDDDDPFIAANELMTAAQLDVGQWSEPVKITDGYAIVMLSGRKQDDPLGRSSVRQRARREVALSKADPLTEVERKLRVKYDAKLLDHEADS
ncbi:peptidylprolyl isomerase [Paenibacillus sp. ACRRX]|uniref:peptidylprolyl isomerase n=1 Tax=unclassified Paenibacillus TaxID=185978 RepID=UPI001EF3F9F6|nr:MULTISPECIES: peptidylprolyl isomerase [unclassified Paenibacillus]MCG7410750.1 peptidylprolyl isomerase [Paenibacillus sp. ACRRX]MDK8184124.1 peptidylprolyl isomerase [Paenibacillus sp. UMB4589-SE434]